VGGATGGGQVLAASPHGGEESWRKDILIACVDGLKGFPEAIETIYPHTEAQLCIVHLVRASLNYVQRLSEPEPGAAAELGSHHAFFPLSGRFPQGDLYDQQRGGTASLATQEHQNSGSFSQRGVGAEVAISGDPASVDHARHKLEASLKLLHRLVARAHAQGRQVA